LSIFFGTAFQEISTERYKK